MSFFVISCLLYGCDGSHHLEALNGIVIIYYWYLYGVPCWEANFSL